MPSCGVSADNKLYLVYSAMAESHNDGVQTFRHLYIMNSTDGGTTWSSPEDYTPDFSFAIYEAVYPSMADYVDSSIHIVYMRDFNPGHSISGDLDPAGINEIVYLGVDTTLDEPISSVIELENNYSINLFPNPATNNLNIRINTIETVNENINVSVVDALGRTVALFNERINGTNALLNINVTNLKSGTYFVRLQSENSVISKLFIKK